MVLSTYVTSYNGLRNFLMNESRDQALSLAMLLSPTEKQMTTKETTMATIMVLKL